MSGLWGQRGCWSQFWGYWRLCNRLWMIFHHDTRHMWHEPEVLTSPFPNNENTKSSVVHLINWNSRGIISFALASTAGFSRPRSAAQRVMLSTQSNAAQQPETTAQDISLQAFSFPFSLFSLNVFTTCEGNPVLETVCSVECGGDSEERGQRRGLRLRMDSWWEVTFCSCSLCSGFLTSQRSTRELWGWREREWSM